jgi:hypothetical protein
MAGDPAPRYLLPRSASISKAGFLIDHFYFRQNASFPGGNSNNF